MAFAICQDSLSESGFVLSFSFFKGSSWAIEFFNQMKLVVKDIHGLENITSLGRADGLYSADHSCMYIENNPSLESISGFCGLAGALPGYLHIGGCVSLRDLHGLETFCFARFLCSNRATCVEHTCSTLYIAFAHKLFSESARQFRFDFQFQF